MKTQQIELARLDSRQARLARKVMTSLKKHWMKTNPHVRIIMKYFKEKYGELPRSDHMAIRSISGIGFGIDEANSLFSALGYKFGGYWPIPKLNIMACHFEPPAPDLEKIFFSEIQLEDIGKNIPAKEFEKIKKIVKQSIYSVADEIDLKCGSIYTSLNFAKRYNRVPDSYSLVNFFTDPPSDYLIRKNSDFKWLSEKSYLQETTHVLAYGFIPNHFTFLLKDPNYTFPGYTTMENLSKEIESLGIKMQEQVEGNEDSILCQVSTKATEGLFGTYNKRNDLCFEIMPMKWPMSYIEFIKRGADPASPTGRYEGFLPNQAQTLFKMTASTH